ncbi:MAG: phosphotransferase [Thermodesulfovibrionales bacterium]
MINEEAVRAYLKQRFRNAIHVDIKKMGSGVQGSGFLIEMKTEQGLQCYVIKALFPEGLGHDYPSDRAAVFLLDLDEYDNLPRHVRALDVLSEHKDGSIHSIGGGREYYLLMEKGEGRDYFTDLTALSLKDRLEVTDREKINAMTSYLAGIHSVKKKSKALYWRKIRDTIGHGECLMGVFDTYPEGTLSYHEMAEIEKKAIQWRARLKPEYERLSQIHGDFHPGNIWFKDTSDFILLDRSRGPWGEPADDVTALTINYIFFSIMHSGMVSGAYLEGLQLFFEDYVRKSGDVDIYSVLQPFYAFRGVVVASPLFYPDVTLEKREMIFRFIRNVLDSERFEPAKVNDYLG